MFGNKATDDWANGWEDGYGAANGGVGASQIGAFEHIATNGLSKHAAHTATKSLNKTSGHKHGDIGG